MARRPTTPPDAAAAAEQPVDDAPQDGRTESDNPGGDRPVRPCTADDPGDRNADGVPLLIDHDGPGEFIRQPRRSTAEIEQAIAARREAAPVRRERIERGVADLDIRVELLSDLDAAHARAEAADLAELLAGAPKGRA